MIIEYIRVESNGEVRLVCDLREIEEAAVSPAVEEEETV